MLHQHSSTVCNTLTLHDTPSLKFDSGTVVCVPLLQDILIQGEGGAQILVDPELVEHFEVSLTKVRTVPIEVSRVPLSQLRVAPPRKQETNSIEASLRLDAVASAGELTALQL